MSIATQTSGMIPPPPYTVLPPVVVYFKESGTSMAKLESVGSPESIRRSISSLGLYTILVWTLDEATRVK